MKYIFLLVTMLFNSSVFAQSLNKLDEKNGFKSYKLGSNVSEYRLKKYGGFPVDDEKDYYMGYCKTYESNQTYSIGDLKISNASFMAFSNKIIRIDLNADVAQTKEFIQLYSNLYGKPQISSGTSKFYNIKNYSWTGNKVKLIVKKISNKFSGEESHTTIVYISIPLLNQMRNKEKVTTQERPEIELMVFSMFAN